MLSTDVYLVVANSEMQYSVWLADREVPAGWSAVGMRGTRDECLDHIERVWTDMRPLSMRLRLEMSHPTPKGQMP